MSHLYLLTLEIVPLNVGQVYNPLPSHLTLMSRFRSDLPPEGIATLIEPVLRRTKPIEITFGKLAVLGAKKTHVHLIEPAEAYMRLHEQLHSLLTKAGVTYVTPQFVGSGHKPHVSMRNGDGFTRGHRHLVSTVYVIEIVVRGDQHLRYIRTKLALGDTEV